MNDSQLAKDPDPDSGPKAESFEVSQAQAIFDALTLLICLLPGAPLPLIAINTIGTSYEPWIPVAAIISAIQYGLLGYILYFLSPWLTFILVCCLLPFYLNLLMGIIKPRSIAP